MVDLVNAQAYLSRHFVHTYFVGFLMSWLKCASARDNLSSGFPTMPDSNQPTQLQRLARKLKIRM